MNSGQGRFSSLAPMCSIPHPWSYSRQVVAHIFLCTSLQLSTSILKYEQILMRRWFWSLFFFVDSKKNIRYSRAHCCGIFALMNHWWWLVIEKITYFKEMYLIAVVWLLGCCFNEIVHHFKYACACTLNLFCLSFFYFAPLSHALMISLFLNW